MRLPGKIALITGAASGIGRATALRFAQEGAQVVVADINEAGGQAVVAEIAGAGGQASFVRADVGDPVQVSAMVQHAVETYGGLDILHNNAYWTDAQYAVETTLENWQKTMDVTLRAVLLGAQAAIPHMRRRGGGVIVNTASVQSLVGFPGYAAYQAAKGGMMALTRALALELAPDIRVVAVLPGATDTPAVRISQDISVDHMIADIPLKRLGKPEEMASTALFLASDEAAYITGTGILVDGGYAIP